MSGLPLEPTATQRRSISTEVLAFLDEWLDRRDESPASWPETSPQLLDELLVGPTEDGRDLSSLLGDIARATDTGFDTAGQGFLSYIPSGGLYTAALGALIGAVTNQYTGAAHASPGMTAIEESVIMWMADLFGLPPTAGGVLLSGGSIANQTAVVTARSVMGSQAAKGVVYASAHAHHSIEKAVRIAGIPTDHISLVGTDEHGRLDTEALKRTMTHDAATGLQPMLIVATAGTTDIGAVDPIGVCADIAAETGAWFHVDAAYGGFFQLTERGRNRLEGIGRADSITLDAHKSLFLPFGIGGLLVRDRSAVIEAHQGTAPYMQDIMEGALPHFMELGPELTRPNRGIQLWLALNLHGVGGFRDELDRMLDIAARTADSLDAIPGIELFGTPELSVVAFRASEGDEMTGRVLEALLASRRVHVSSTTVNGRIHIRLAFLSQRTTEPVVDEAVSIVADVVGGD